MTLVKARPDDILRAADRLQPELRDAFLAAVAATNVDLDDLAAALELGNLSAAVAAVGAVEVPDEIAQVLADVIEGLPPVEVAQFTVRFDLIERQAVRFARTRAAELVTAVTSETREAIRDVVTDALRAQLEPGRGEVRLQARAIEQMVGLTRRDARAVQRFVQGGLEGGVDSRLVERQAKRMSARLLRRRAENIARTETMTAANAGRDMQWKHAMDRGLLPANARRVWIVTPDQRLCSECAPMRDMTVQFGDEFVSTETAVLQNRGRGVQVVGTRERTQPITTRTPPLHPSCRCTVGLVFD